MTSSVLVGYARVSTDAQDLTAQQDALQALGVSTRLIYSDKGMTGTNRDRPSLREALAACREGDTLVVRSSTASPEPSETRPTSPKSSRNAKSVCTSAARSTIPPTR